MSSSSSAALSSAWDSYSLRDLCFWGLQFPLARCACLTILHDDPMLAPEMKEKLLDLFRSTHVPLPPSPLALAAHNGKYYAWDSYSIHDLCRWGLQFEESRVSCSTFIRRPCFCIPYNRHIIVEHLVNTCAPLPGTASNLTMADYIARYPNGCIPTQRYSKRKRTPTNFPDMIPTSLLVDHKRQRHSPPRRTNAFGAPPVSVLPPSSPVSVLPSAPPSSPVSMIPVSPVSVLPPVLPSDDSDAVLMCSDFEVRRSAHGLSILIPKSSDSERDSRTLKTICSALMQIPTSRKNRIQLTH